MLSIFLLAALAGFGVASPRPAVEAADASDLVNSAAKKNVTILTQNQIHANVISNMDAERIVHSDNLYDYFSKHHGADHLIYVNDSRHFIHMSSVQPKHDKRQWSQ